MNKTKFYQELDSNPNFSEIEQKIISFWQENDCFYKSVNQRPSDFVTGKGQFVFYDGPPFANGLPHYGHLLTGFVKDIFARYQTMKGKKVERRFGWDCHGLPAEMGAQKELGISGRQQISKFGIDKFNEQCRTSVMQYTSQWQDYVTRQARWVDFKNDYKTMDINFMESVIWAFKQLYDKGLVYESMRVMPYSWACETPLSNFETRLDNSYRERTDKAITVSFTLKTKPDLAPNGFEKYKILAWTTTPWTLPSNLALAVSADLEYAFVPKDKICYIISHSAIGKYAKELGLGEEELKQANFKTIKGEDLAGLEYEPLFPYFANHSKSFIIFAADFVTDTDGTGVVHLAPGFGEDDQIVCEKNGIKLVCPVDNAGKFTNEITDFAGLQVFEANDPIIIKLKNQGDWLKTEQYIHNYPHCWRTDTPLIYKAVPSWYVKVTAFKDRMVELNQEINWIPLHIKNGQFGKWLENARDWSISRNRFWGSPIPIWKSDNPKFPRIDVYGSIAQLEQDFGVTITDLHRPFIDELTRPNPDDPSGKSIMRRVEDVFDCWFESGSMPYAQLHYPFENKEKFEQNFPADFIVEYVAQTRGWFYTLMVLSTALFDRPPFLNCICHGVVLDDKGQKLSKRLNNYADPMDVFAKFGADAMRWVMVSAPIMHGGELLIDKEGNMIRDAVRLIMKPIWNSYHFFCLYANADGIKADFNLDSINIMDRYILAKCKDAVAKIAKYLDNYDTPLSCRTVEDFYEILNNWYIRRNKDRFWKSTKDSDKQSAYNTLYSVQHIMARAVSPLLPLLAEEIFLGLTGKNESVHLQYFPDLDKINDDSELIKSMDLARSICNSALAIRNAENIRVRQPLQLLSFIAKEPKKVKEFSDLICDELNVKNLQFFDKVEDFAEYKLKINFPVLGKRLSHKVKDIIAASKQGNWQINDDKLVVICGETLNQDEFSLLLEPKNKKGAQTLDSNDALVILDLDISQELLKEGIARDLIRLVQQSRKEANLDISDRINLFIDTDQDNISNAIADFKSYIASQTLALSVNEGEKLSFDKNKNLSLNEGKNDNFHFAQEIEGNKVVISFKVAQN